MAAFAVGAEEVAAQNVVPKPLRMKVADSQEIMTINPDLLSPDFMETKLVKKDSTHYVLHYQQGPHTGVVEVENADRDKELKLAEVKQGRLHLITNVGPHTVIAHMASGALAMEQDIDAYGQMRTTTFDIVTGKVTTFSGKAPPSENFGTLLYGRTLKL